MRITSGRRKTRGHRPGSERLVGENEQLKHGGCGVLPRRIDIEASEPGVNYAQLTAKPNGY